MGVRRRLLRDLLSSLKYIKNLTEQQIHASLWRGEATLTNIELDPRRAQELLVDVIPVGLEILDVRIDELYVKIPWSQLGTQSMLIVARNVHARFAVHCADEAEWRETIGSMLRRNRQKINATLHAAPGSLADPAGALNQLRQRIMHSLQLRADHVTVTAASHHRRHHSAHRPDSPDGVEDALTVEFQDVLLSPCDAERAPSDSMKAMAIFEPGERVLQLTRLLKCRAFTVVPPLGFRLCPCAVPEYMESPGALACTITDRCTSDGTRICPTFVSMELHFEVPGAVRIKCCECQLAAFLALLSDIGQLEEWRLDKALVAEKRPELMNTSDVARTFAQGPDPLASRSKSANRGTPKAAAVSSTAGLLRANSASEAASKLTSSLWRLGSSLAGPGKQKPRGVAAGFHPLELPEEPDCAPDASSTPTHRSRANSVELLAARSPPAWSACASEAGAAEAEAAEVLLSEEAEEAPWANALSDDEDEDDDAHSDYFSVGSEGCTSVGSPLGEERPPLRATPDWLDTMRSWLGATGATASAGSAASPGEEANVDVSSQRTRLQVSFGSLHVHIAVPAPAGGAGGEPEGAPADVAFAAEALTFCLEAKMELSEAQRACVRRFAWPSEEHPEPLWPWQLPRRVSSSQRLTMQRYSVSCCGVAAVRALDPEQLPKEAMFTLVTRSRTAPPEVLVSPAGGAELLAWPGSLRLAHTLFRVDEGLLGTLGGLFKRVKPFLNGKVPLSELVSATGGSGAPSGQDFPAQCMQIELSACDVAEHGEAGAIQREQRWPWRASFPRAVLRSDSALWNLCAALGEPVVRSLPAMPEASGGDAVHGAVAAADPNAGRGEKDMVSIPTEMFEDLVRRAAEVTKKDAQVSAAREELQRAYISIATLRPHASSSASSGAVAKTPAERPAKPPATAGGGSHRRSRGVAKAGAKADQEEMEGQSSSDGDQEELDRLRQKCLQLQLSLQSQALTQRRLETELAHYQTRAQEELRRAIAGRRPEGTG